MPASYTASADRPAAARYKATAAGAYGLSVEAIARRAAALDGLLAEFSEAAAGGGAPAEIARRLLETAGTPRPDGVGALARLTMLMWLYGVWYGATETARVPGSAAVLAPARRTDAVVSVHAYRNAWIWRFAQASPAGVAAAAPGDWAEPPPGLARFLSGA